MSDVYHDSLLSTTLTSFCSLPIWVCVCGFMCDCVCVYVCMCVRVAFVWKSKQDVNDKDFYRFTQAWRLVSAHICTCSNETKPNILARDGFKLRVHCSGARVQPQAFQHSLAKGSFSVAAAAHTVHLPNDSMKHNNSNSENSLNSRLGPDNCFSTGISKNAIKHMATMTTLRHASSPPA